MTTVGRSLRSAAMVASSFFGRFGDTQSKKDYAPQDIRGTHKFKRKHDERFDQDVEKEPEPKFEIREMPENPSFRQWSNHWRQFTRRVFVFHKGGTFSGGRERFGKKLTRALKREKVRAMKAAGHFKGDNRPVFYS